VVQAVRGIPPGFNPNTTVVSEKRGYSLTTHFSIIDKDGSIASVTATLADFFGSGQVVPGLGFLLNNMLGVVDTPMAGRRLRRTALPPDNITLGARRTALTSTPTLVLNQDKVPYLALGTPGAQYIPANTLATLLNVIEFDMSLSDAVLSPRYNSLNNGQWGFEEELFNNTELMKELQLVGIPLRQLEGASAKGDINIVKRDPNGYVDAFADPRRKGYALVK